MLYQQYHKLPVGYTGIPCMEPATLEQGSGGQLVAYVPIWRPQDSTIRKQTESQAVKTIFVYCLIASRNK